MARAGVRSVSAGIKNTRPGNSGGEHTGPVRYLMKKSQGTSCHDLECKKGVSLGLPPLENKPARHNDASGGSRVGDFREHCIMAQQKQG